jgi:hypothetical protein
MMFLKYRYLTLTIVYFAIACISGCEFDDPYVPESAGSSTLTGRIVTEPFMSLTGAEVFLRGQNSFGSVTGADGFFHFQDISPGNYSLQIQKKPYLQYSQPMVVHKSTDEDLGDIKIELKGAIAGTIPDDKIAIVHGEVEVIVYIDGIPFVPQQDSEGDLTIDLSSPESAISIQAEPKITVYIDNVPYSATVQDGGNFIVEFIDPGIYNDIRVRLNSQETSFPLVSGGTVVVKSGQTRFIP